jgi:hypothetical protein
VHTGGHLNQTNEAQTLKNLNFEEKHTVLKEVMAESWDSHVISLFILSPTLSLSFPPFHVDSDLEKKKTVLFVGLFKPQQKEVAKWLFF